MLKASVCWATGKRLTNRLSNLSLTTLSPPETAGYSGPDRIYGSTCHHLAVPISGDSGRVFFRFDTEKLNFSLNRIVVEGGEIRNSRAKAHVLPSSPFVKALYSPLGYWQKVNQSPTQAKPCNT